MRLSTALAELHCTVLLRHAKPRVGLGGRKFAALVLEILLTGVVWKRTRCGTQTAMNHHHARALLQEHLLSPQNEALPRAPTLLGRLLAPAGASQGAA